jgi:hypothetical protein
MRVVPLIPRLPSIPEMDTRRATQNLRHLLCETSAFSAFRRLMFWNQTNRRDRRERGGFAEDKK